MSIDWFRWYHGSVSDPKFTLIARKSKQPRSLVISVWASLLEYASTARDRGSLADMEPDTIAACLDAEDEAVTSILTTMISKGLIKDERIASWETRQVYREDDSRERVRRYREKNRQAHASVTQCNASSRIGNAPEEETDTDADTDKESSKQREVEEAESVGAQAPFATATTRTKPGLRPVKNFPQAPDWLPADTWQAYIDHRKAKRSAMTPQSAIMVLRDLDKARGFGHDPVTLIESAIGAGWTGCVFADKHFIPTATVAAQPRNGQHPPATKHDHLIDQNRQALNAWLTPSVHVIEGECHEVH